MSSKRPTDSGGDEGWRAKRARLGGSKPAAGLPDPKPPSQQSGVKRFGVVASSDVPRVVIDLTGDDSDETPTAPARKQAPPAQSKAPSLTKTQRNSERPDLVSTVARTIGGGTYDTCFGLVGLPSDGP